MTEYKILIVDRYGAAITSFIEFTSLSIIDTANDVGRWEVSSRTPYRQPFTENSYAIIFRDGIYTFGGPIYQITETYDYVTKVWTWKVSGYGFNAILKNLLVYPSAFDQYLQFTDRDFSVTGTSAGTVIASLINDNASTDNHMNSHIPGYGFIAGAVARSLGASVDLTCRFENLLTTCQNLAAAADLFIIPTYDKTTGKVTYIITESLYPNRRVIFSIETGSVKSYSHIYTSPECTKVVLSYNDDTSWQNVYESGVYTGVTVPPISKELFVKPTKEQITLSSFADIAAQTAKEKYADPNRMELTVNPNGYIYGYDYDWDISNFTTDYRIGDIVTIVLPDEVLTARIMQMNIDVSYGEETMKPVFGDVTRGKFSKIFYNLKNLNSSVSKNDNTEVSS